MSNLKDIAKSLECPICLELPRTGHISQCDNGHMLCKACRPKVNVCPICNLQLRNVRNLFAETVVDYIPFPCKFKDDGCGEKLQNEERIKHEKICPFRKVQCPCFEMCPEQRISLTKLQEHASRVHYLNMGFDTRRFDMTCYTSWKPRQKKFLDKTFYDMCVQDDRSKIWFFWVYVEGTEDDAKNFKFEVCFKNLIGDHLKYRSFVTSIDLKQSDVIKSQVVCAIPNSTLKNFSVCELQLFKYK